MIRWIIVASLAVLAGVTLTACESSQDKAKRIQEQAIASAPKPLTIAKPDKDVELLDTTLLRDQNGDAVAVELKNNSKRTLVNAPILVTLKDAKGKAIYANNAPGLDLALNHVPLLEPGQTVTWVNDQLGPAGVPKSVKVVVGQPDSPAPKQLPELEVSEPRFRSTSLGLQVIGTVANHSKILQRKLVLFAIAKRGDRIVAAGRGLIKKVKPNKPGNYVIFFIGDPQGADVTVQAPPVTLK